MTSVLAALLFVVLIWWAGTAVVLILQHRIRQPNSLMVRMALAVAALIAVVTLAQSSGVTHGAAHFVAFVAGVALWGCLELSYYLGLITGTHTRPCPQGLDTTQRFRTALSASIWHELTVVATGLGITALLWGSANPTGLYAFLVLWLMRWSAKLNLFLGVPHFATHWFPERMAYLASYIRNAPITPFFILSLTLASLALAALLVTAMRTEGASALAYGLPASLLILAVIEHLFMALPIADSRLWSRVFDTSSPARRATS